MLSLNDLLNIILHARNIIKISCVELIIYIVLVSSRMEGFRLPLPSQIHASINPFLMDLHVYFDMCLNLWFHILYLHLL